MGNRHLHGDQWVFRSVVDADRVAFRHLLHAFMCFVGSPALAHDGGSR